MGNLPIVRPQFPDLQTIKDRLNFVLRTGQVTNNGHYVREFEDKLSEILGVPTLVFNNGMTALMTMLKAAGVEGREVICPSFTFVATPNAIKWAGGTPVFADVNRYGCLDPVDVRRKLNAATIAILGVDPYGICCDYKILTQIAREHGVYALFDSAAAFGSTVDDKITGGFGDAQIFSFHATKPFSTMEGGCLCTNNPIIRLRAATLRNFGLSNDGEATEIGLNGKMMEVCALIGIESLKDFDRQFWSRTSNSIKLARELYDIPGLTVLFAPIGQNPVWLYRPIFIDQEKYGRTRDETVELMHRAGIMVRRYYSPPCHLMNAYKSEHTWHLSVTEKLASQVIALPVYSDMQDGEIETIAETLRGLCRGKQ